MKHISRRIYVVHGRVGKNWPAEFSFEDFCRRKEAKKGRLMFQFHYNADPDPEIFFDAALYNYKYISVGRKLLQNQEFCQHLIEIAKGNRVIYNVI